MSWRREMDGLYGKRVIVTISHDPLIEVTGVLIWATDDGECALDTNEGRRYVWPNLKARADR